MKKYIFNRNEFTWAEEFYDIIKKKMELPDYFGCNADALWDMLTGYIDTPCEIVLVGFIGGSLKRPFLLGSLYPNAAGVVNDNFHKETPILWKFYNIIANSSTVCNIPFPYCFFSFFRYNIKVMKITE